jgi:ABC-2 type transport system permease protein
MSAMVRSRVLFSLELAEALRSRWILFTSAVYTVVFAAFVWLGLHESSVLGFTGLSRVVLNVSNAVVLAVPLVALVATSQALVKPRQSGFFELVLSQPVRRSEWLLGAVAARLIVVVAPLLLLFGAAVVASWFGQPKDTALLPTIARCLGVTVSLAWAFLGIGFWISSVSRTAERATVLALLAWLMASALHDFALIGALLQLRWPPQVVFALAAANPVESARIAVLSSVDPELSVLGPVGFWLANTLGARLMLAVGIVWPALLGTTGLLAAHRRLNRADLIG